MWKDYKRQDISFFNIAFSITGMMNMFFDNRCEQMFFCKGPNSKHLGHIEIHEGPYGVCHSSLTLKHTEADTDNKELNERGCVPATLN